MLPGFDLETPRNVFSVPRVMIGCWWIKDVLPPPVFKWQSDRATTMFDDDTGRIE